MKSVCAALLILGLAALPCPADTLVFKDGRRLEGMVVEEDAETVTFKTKSIQSKFKKAEIQEIVRGEVPVEKPPEDPAAAIRGARLAMTGDAALDPLRDAASRALDGVLEKEKALAGLAKKTETQTKAFEAQLKRVKAAEVAAEKARAIWRNVDAKRQKAQEAVDAALLAGKQPTAAQVDELESKKGATEAAWKPAQAADAKVVVEAAKLEEQREKYQASALTLRPAIMELSAAVAALDDAWSALAAAERAAERAPLGWFQPGGSAARVRIEGRVVRASGGELVLATGKDMDAGKWKDEVKLLAPGLEAKEGEILVIRARFQGAGWVAEEVER
ncbi:MAG: hypothetical protein HYY18_11360 [Planctomycetes bacterium]|nr:hypothetical protein [Planctomycetota bacterium]